MKAFFAYPSDPAYISPQIAAAVADLTGTVSVHTWEENDICGRPLIEPILEHINDADLMFADITRLNFNVTFEIGYAISKGKRVFLVRSKDTPLDDRITEVGIFDTLGFKTYSSKTELADIMSVATPENPLPVRFPLDRRAPIYFVLPRRPDDLIGVLHAKLKKTGFNFRSFNPQEDTRLPAVEAVEHTLSSFGVVVPLLAPDQVDWDVHNQRAAFVAGLAFGADLPLLLVQQPGGPIPLDVRDFAVTVRHPDDLKDLVQNLAVSVTNRTQDFEDRPAPNLTALAKLHLGDPMAENELETIDQYFLQTDQYLRTERGEVRLVVGRKGTGKTAIFGHLADKKRASSNNVVVDLKPEGYQLVKLREGLLAHLAQGSKYHLLVAFWEMILCLELCNRILVDDEKRHLADHRLFEPYNRLKARYSPYLDSHDTDFSERLSSISESIIQAFKKHRGSPSMDLTLSSSEVTNILYETDIRAVREDLKSYLAAKSTVYVMFDNLDRGWPETGLTTDDVLVIRSLIEASAKLQRDMRSKDVDFSSIVFLRNDVYQILMKSTPDFGKDMRAQLDWTDPDQIKEMVRLRLANAMDDDEVKFDAAWHQIAVSHIDGEESFQFLIDRSFYRPRNVLKLINHCRAAAINARHEMMEEDDIEKGVNAFSQDVLIEADREITDVMPETKQLLYQFMGERSLLSKGELNLLLSRQIESQDDIDRVVERLLYFGFIGLERAGATRYIYNVAYNMELLKVELSKFSGQVRYQINPAFWPALYIV